MGSAFCGVCILFLFYFLNITPQTHVFTTEVSFGYQRQKMQIGFQEERLNKRLNHLKK